MTSSPSPSAAAYLVAFTSMTAEVLGPDLVGAYPHGSLVLGGWRPERSDIDVLVVAERSLSADQQAALAAACSPASLPCPAVGLEASVVLRSVAAHPVARSAYELHVTTAPGDAKVIDGHQRDGDPDLVLHFAVCRSVGHEVFAEVPRPLILAQLVDELAWATDHAPPTYAVLNACRAWRYAADAALVSKLDGGRWAEQRLSGAELTLVRAAMASQTGESTVLLDPLAARTFTLRLRDVIRTEV